MQSSRWLHLVCEISIAAWKVHALIPRLTFYRSFRAMVHHLNYAHLSVWNIGLYTISQDRSVEYITSYKLPDVLGLAVGLPCA
jgi:hypothetical protein